MARSRFDRGSETIRQEILNNYNKLKLDNQIENSAVKWQWQEIRQQNAKNQSTMMEMKNPSTGPRVDLKELRKTNQQMWK